MRIFSLLLFSVAISFPVLAQAEIPFVFSDVSAGVFRFQIKLAEQGNPEAQYKVGEMYELGKGVSRDMGKATEWYQKAAGKGHLKASYKMLFLDIKAKGLNTGSKAQVAALRKEASGGNADAQYFLGKMYAAGVGVPKNLNKSISWYNKAAFNGIPEAEHEAIAVEEELARIKERSAKRRAVAEAEEKKKREAERQAKLEAEAKAKAQKEREARQKREQAAKREAERRRAAERKDAEQRRRDRERAEAEAAAAEKERQEKERLAKEQSQDAKPASTSSTTFEADPCKGKKARFLSICK